MESFILIAFAFVIVMIITIMAALLKFLWIWVRMRIYLWRLSHFPFANQPLYFLVARKALELLHRTFRKLACVLRQQGHFSISEPEPPVQAMANEPTAPEPVIPKEEKPPFHTTAVVVKMPGYAQLDVAEFYAMLEEGRQRRLTQKLRFLEEQNSLAPLFFGPVVQYHPDWVLAIRKEKATRVINTLEAIRFWKDARAIRTLESWSPKPLENIEQYLDDLVHHLFARYEVPSFIRSFWHSWKKWPKKTVTAGRPRERRNGDPRLGSSFFDLYFHMTAGGSLRKAGFLPFRLSKRAAGLYVRAPEELNPVQAFWWATFTAFGGHWWRWRTLAPLSFDLEQQDFWKQFLMLVARQPNDRNPTFAYYIIRLIKFGDGPFAFSRVYEPEVWIEPDFSLKGHTLESLEAYFAKLTTTAPFRYPPPTNLEREYRIAGFEDQSYRIVWLDNCQALIKESGEMHHCLGDFDQGYHADALKGYKSYWSLRLQEANGVEKRLVTFELEEGRIMEISGPENKNPDPKYQDLILEWAWEQGLRLVA